MYKHEACEDLVAEVLSPEKLKKKREEAFSWAEVISEMFGTQFVANTGSVMFGDATEYSDIDVLVYTTMDFYAVMDFMTRFNDFECSIDSQYAEIKDHHVMYRHVDPKINVNLIVVTDAGKYSAWLLCNDLAWTLQLKKAMRPVLFSDIIDQGRFLCNHYDYDENFQSSNMITREAVEATWRMRWDELNPYE